jgi:hypothetical protein
MLEHKRSNGVDIVAPDRVNELARLDEPRPTRDTIAAGEYELRIGEPYWERRRLARWYRRRKVCIL